MADIRQLEQLQQFAAFIDFLKNPKEYESILRDAQKVVADFHKVKTEQRQIADIDSYRQYVEKEAKEAMADLERMKNLLVAEREAFVAEKQSQMQGVAKARTELEETILEAQRRTVKLADLQNLSDRLDGQAKRLVAEDTRLGVWAAELQAKADALAKLFKD